jgi:hypothetical protein
MSPDLDKHLTLQGDEDCGVGVQCLICDSGGLPVAYYGWDNPYSNVPEIVYVERSITALIEAATQHLATKHMRQ